MGTTIWVDEDVRASLRELQERLGTGSVNATLRHLLASPATDAHALFALHRDAIRAIMTRHGVRRLVAFGSRVRGEARPGSDLDLAVEMEKRAPALALLAAEADLEAELGLPVNVVELPAPRLARTLKREGVPFEA